MKIGALCSGALGFDLLKEIHRAFEMTLVFTDKQSDNIIDYCNKYNIPVFIGNPRNGKGFEFIKDFTVDVLISVNYLFIIEKDIFSYPKKLSFNIHGSLLARPYLIFLSGCPSL